MMSIDQILEEIWFGITRLNKMTSQGRDIGVKLSPKNITSIGKEMDQLRFVNKAISIVDKI